MPSPPQTASAASRVAAAGEHRQPGQQRLFGPGEQLEGPVDRGPQRLVTCHRAARPGREHREAALQPPGQLGRGHRRHPRRRQLDRQRDPIQPPDHRGDRRRVLGGHRETGLDRGRALGEQPHRLRLRDRVQVGIGAGHRQRRHRNQPLPLDPQALAAGGQDHQPLTRPRQHPGQRRRPVQQMLTVVQHQQQFLAAQELHQRLAGALPGPGGHREHRGDRVVHPGRVADRGQLSTATRRRRTAAPPARRPATPAGSCPPRPAPVSVTTRAWPSAAAVCSSSRSRPMNELTGTGRLPVRSATVRSGGKSAGQVSVGQLVDQLRLGQVAQPELAQPLSARTRRPAARRPGRGWSW